MKVQSRHTILDKLSGNFFSKCRRAARLVLRLRCSTGHHAELGAISITFVVHSRCSTPRMGVESAASVAVGAVSALELEDGCFPSADIASEQSKKWHSRWLLGVN